MSSARELWNEWESRDFEGDAPEGLKEALEALDIHGAFEFVYRDTIAAVVPRTPVIDILMGRPREEVFEEQRMALKAQTSARLRAEALGMGPPIHYIPTEEMP